MMDCRKTRILGRNFFKVRRLYLTAFPKIERHPVMELFSASYNGRAEDNGATLGCLRVFMYDDTYAQIGRVVTSQKIRGNGWGLEMMKTGIRLVKEHFGNAPILIHAQAYATGFYEKVGFKISSGQFLEDGIPHYEMIRPADTD